MSRIEECEKCERKEVCLFPKWHKKEELIIRKKSYSINLCDRGIQCRGCNLHPDSYGGCYSANVNCKELCVHDSEWLWFSFTRRENEYSRS